MKALTITDLLSIEEFVTGRRGFEQKMIAAKAPRRIFLGDAMILCFENRDSVWWQVQEMCRVEGIRDPAAVQHELDTYNALLPNLEELSATLLVGYADPAERDQKLRLLVGLQNHLFLELDGFPRISARFDKEQFSTDRISSVQFVRFPLTSEQRAAFLDFRKPAYFVVDHPAYAAKHPLPAGVRGALVEDLLAD